jgi:hypothetical protein
VPFGHMLHIGNDMTIPGGFALKRPPRRGEKGMYLGHSGLGETDEKPFYRISKWWEVLSNALQTSLFSPLTALLKRLNGRPHAGIYQRELLHRFAPKRLLPRSFRDVREVFAQLQLAVLALDKVHHKVQSLVPS